MKLLTHERDKVGDFQRRALLHIPIGILIGIPLFGSPLEKLFIKYEENEDKWVKDQAWKDYFGAMVGTAITEITFLVGLGFLIRYVIQYLGGQ